MPKPFPLPFQIGTDICSIRRILRLLRDPNSSLPERFIARILTPIEISQSADRLGDRVERWRMAARTRAELEWKRKEMGLEVRELTKRHWEKGVGRLGSNWAKEIARKGKGRIGKEMGRSVRDELRRSLEREVKEEDGANRKSVGASGDGHASISAREQLGFGNIEDEAKPRLERLDEVDIWVNLVVENQEELLAAEEGLRKAAEFMAGRFAAKEAAIKAHHSRKLTYHSIAIHSPPDTKDGSKPPIGVILPEDGNWEEGQEMKISISHDGGYATAVCLAFDPSSNFSAEGPLTGV